MREETVGRSATNLRIKVWRLPSVRKLTDSDWERRLLSLYQDT